MAYAPAIGINVHIQRYIKYTLSEMIVKDKCPAWICTAVTTDQRGQDGKKISTGTNPSIIALEISAESQIKLKIQFKKKKAKGNILHKHQISGVFFPILGEKVESPQDLGVIQDPKKK